MRNSNQLLCNVMFSDHEQIEGRMRLKWSWLMEHRGHSRLDNWSVRSVLNVTCTTDKGNGEIFVDKGTAWPVTDALVFLLVLSNCYGPMQSSERLFEMSFSRPSSSKNRYIEIAIDWFICRLWRETCFSQPVPSNLAADLHCWRYNLGRTFSEWNCRAQAFGWIQECKNARQIRRISHDCLKWKRKCLSL